MEFIRSNLIKDHTMATETLEKDLPTNPISHLIISWDGYNVTDEATLAEILAFLTKIEVTRSGVTVVSASGADLYGINTYLYANRPNLTGRLATDNEQRNLSLIVPFGRRIFDPTECHPATKKGDLTLRVTNTAFATSIDNGTVNIECVELVGAAPSTYLKTNQITVAAPGATGDHDTDLPIGNDIACIQMRMVTVPTTSSHTYGVDVAKILVENREYGYATARAQCLEGDAIFLHENQYSTIAAQGLDVPANIVYLDFDPARDSKFLLQTAGKSSVKLRATMGVNEALYLTLLEVVKV